MKGLFIFLTVSWEINKNMFCSGLAWPLIGKTHFPITAYKRNKDLRSYPTMNILLNLKRPLSNKIGESWKKTAELADHLQHTDLSGFCTTVYMFQTVTTGRLFSHGECDTIFEKSSRWLRLTPNFKSIVGGNVTEMTRELVMLSWMFE